MSHEYHEGPDDTIYYDGCFECTHKAKDPVPHMDMERSKRLWMKMIDVEIYDNGSYNSENERVAAKNLWRIYLFLERNTTTNPQGLEFLV